MKPAQAMTIVAAASLLLVAARRASSGSVEAGDADLLGGFQPDAILDSAETLFNRITETDAGVDMDTAQQNAAAFLKVLRQSEGTEGRGSYATVYGYGQTIQDFSDHPAITGEWTGVTLSDTMCANAGFGSGCKSTAAGAYQIIKPTWKGLKASLGLPDFGAASQDAAAIELIRRRGALEDVKAGRFAAAINKCRGEWASLPGNSAKQGQRSMDTLAQWFSDAGGIQA